MSQIIIYLVDQDPGFCGRFQGLIESPEIRVHILPGADFALQFLTTAELPPNQSLVVIDATTIAISSEPFIEALQAIGPGFPLLVISYIHETQTMIEMMRKGIIDYMEKSPVDLEKLIERIYQVLGLRSPGYSQRLSYLTDVFYQFSQFSNIDNLLEFMTYSISRVMNAERSSLFLMDHKNEELYSLVAEGVGN